MCLCVCVVFLCVCVCKITAKVSEILKIRNEINPKISFILCARVCVFFLYFVFVLAFVCCLCFFVCLCLCVCVFHSVSFCTTERHVKVRKLKYFAKYLSTAQVSTSILYRELY